MQVLEADKISSATSPLKLTKIVSVISENNAPKVGDVVFVRALSESVTVIWNFRANRLPR